jgi:hypothetical protein
MARRKWQHHPGPGLPQKDYIDMLKAGYETGWWDDHGAPAPWPEDFLDGDWRPVTYPPSPPQPGEPPF